MDKLNVVPEGGQLIVSRRKPPYVAAMAGWTLGFAGVTVIPALGAFVYHKNTSRFYILLALILPLLLLYLYRGMSYLRPWTFVFDREHDFVTLNGNSVCSLTEIKSVHVDRWSYRTGRGSGSVLRLSFLTESGTDEEIDRSGLYGPGEQEMERVGTLIAAYAGVLLIKPEY